MGKIGKMGKIEEIWITRRFSGEARRGI